MGDRSKPGGIRGEAVGSVQLCGQAEPSLCFLAGPSRGQFHTLQSGFSSRSQGLSGDKTSVSDGCLEGAQAGQSVWGPL